MKPTKNFLSWYKFCCENDSSVYRKTIFNQKKAKVYYLATKNNDFAVYPLNGTEKILSGTREFCEQIIQNEINITDFPHPLFKRVCLMKMLSR